MLGPCHPIKSRWHCYTIELSLAWDYLANDIFGPLRKVWFRFTGVDWSHSWWFKKHLHLQNLFDRLLTMCHLINWNIATQRYINHIIKPRFGKKEISPNWKKARFIKSNWLPPLTFARWNVLTPPPLGDKPADKLGCETGPCWYK